MAISNGALHRRVPFGKSSRLRGLTGVFLMVISGV